MSPELQQLIALQELDIKIQELAKKIAAVPLERERIEQNFNTFAAEYHQARQLREQALQRRKPLELELETNQIKMEKYKQDLMKVRNEKEYATVLREIDAAKKLIGTLEIQIIELGDEAEKLEQQLREMTPDIDGKRAEINAQLDAFAGEIDHASLESERLIAERRSLCAQLKRAVLATYERVSKLRKGIALSEARDSSCAACRMAIRPQIYSDVKRGEKIIQCESCGRILYYCSVVASQQPAAELSV